MNNWAIKFLFYSLGGIVLNKITNNECNNKPALNLPNFRGTLEVKHYIEGRLRLKIPSLIENEEQGYGVLEQLNKIDEINTVEINFKIGTILIKYNEEKIKPILLIGIIIRLLGLENEIQKEIEPIVTKEVKNIKDSLNLAVYDKTKGILDMKNIIMISLIGLGIYRLKISPQLNISGITCLWWAYSFI
ncbi:HMA2 domain-containing protein [Clostridium fallax]|uniref:Uncharacterized protein n=1 Tax=Clostridium fallax TaxID=1533 RepID=A0A1M4XAC1_9CLOT|nr:hypothetical protein [Clostridium fallax]SHE90478.1 hypothetical protein SAMN05443638_1175 [Clostridium fallax]SQB06007.1 Uncharacterised protein [Clostridium fallax]